MSLEWVWKLPKMILTMLTKKSTSGLSFKYRATKKGRTWNPKAFHWHQGRSSFLSGNRALAYRVYRRMCAFKRLVSCTMIFICTRPLVNFFFHFSCIPDYPEYTNGILVKSLLRLKRRKQWSSIEHLSCAEATILTTLD